MKKAFLIILSLAFCAMYPSASVLAVEVDPRISDREIIEKLARLEEGQRGVQQQINDLKESTQQQINDLKESTQQQTNDLKESTNKRFDIIQWMLGLFITVALSLMGI
ncbi:MAG: hypothetical protein HZA01_16825, partial [Nitrospinae bacterium]|nr:hypothetical protein [Nitrospinota bacterium]